MFLTTIDYFLFANSEIKKNSLFHQKQRLYLDQYCRNINIPCTYNAFPLTLQSRCDGKYKEKQIIINLHFKISTRK